ncbi:MAG: sigma-70 family RNA polymerase sigma factor [Labilithrix sp.]|nr:sigma-70 family RNA polymerase sigma factor [Labilithrix sp.]MCW5813281.1 sigma-70 family RNA polymerase sigma factor [Labilithrix sp.]
MAVSALDRVLERRPELLAFLRRRVRPGTDVEDVLQHALLTATAKVAQLRDEERAVAWFYRILRRRLADERARARAWDEKRPLLEAAEDVAPEDPALCACSLGLLDTLAPAYAEVVRRVDLGDEPIADVAAALGTTTNNVTVRLHRARKSLRDRLASTCGTTSLGSCLECDCV